MKTLAKVLSVSMAIALIGTMPVQAQNTVAASNPTYRVDSIIEEPAVLEQEGTATMQEDLLMKINSGLANGAISAVEASRFKAQLNTVSDQESWYRSLNKQIPASVILQNKTMLADIDQKLQPNVVLSAKTDNALHADIDELIGKALARNTISSSDAEKYYMRLAQIESNLSKTKTSGAVEQSASKDLCALRIELSQKSVAVK